MPVDFNTKFPNAKLQNSFEEELDILLAEVEVIPLQEIQLVVDLVALEAVELELDFLQR